MARRKVAQASGLRNVAGRKRDARAALENITVLPVLIVIPSGARDLA